MARIETKKGLEKMLERMAALKKAADEEGGELQDYEYWVLVVKGCIEEGLAMDEVDRELSPDWLAPCWRGLK